MTATVTTVRHGLYRLFDINGGLLYVGVSSAPAARVNDHRGTRWGDLIESMTIEWFAERRDALTAETAAIVTEAPLHNKRRSLDSDPVRTVRVPDELWEAAQSTAWSRRNRAGVSSLIRLALRAYTADADALEAACAEIIGGQS